MAVDLHIHTTASDGLETPEEVVARAAGQGLKAIAITDHDTVAGVDEAIRAGSRFGIEVIPGIEINTNYKNSEVHILGYLLDYKSDILLEQLGHIGKQREERIGKIVDRLNDLGVNIKMEEVLLTAGDSIVGRPHIARTLVAKGVVSSTDRVFDEYIGEGKIAFVPRYGLTPIEAIGLIKRVGGVPVLAHPGLMNHDGLIEELVVAGLQGLEVYHSDHTPEQSVHYRRLAVDHGLVITGGSDYHGAELKHRPMGSATVDYGSVKRLKELSAYYEKSRQNKEFVFRHFLRNGLVKG